MRGASATRAALRSMRQLPVGTGSGTSRSAAVDARSSATCASLADRCRQADIRLATDRAIPVGIIVTELVTNSLKYAYPEKGGEIRVSLAQRDDGMVVLRVADDGIGFDPNNPTDPNTSHGTGVGSRIVDAMTKSLGGTLKIRSTPVGTEINVIFAPDKEPEEDTNA